MEEKTIRIIKRAPTTAKALVFSVTIKMIGNSIKNANGLIAHDTPIHLARPVPPLNLK